MIIDEFELEENGLSLETVQDLHRIFGLSKEEIIELKKKVGTINITKEMVVCDECMKLFYIYHGADFGNQLCPYCSQETGDR